MGFTAIGLMVVAMVGVGVAEEAGLINALIRKLVAVSPAWALTYILAFVGILSSIAADAGYVVLIPLAGAAFLSLGRNPLAGPRARLRRGGRRLQRQHADQAARRGAHRNHQRRDPHGRPDAIDRVSPPVCGSRSPRCRFSTVVIAVVTERDHRAAAGQVRCRHAEGTRRRRSGASSRPPNRAACASPLVALIGVLVVFGLLTISVRRAAAQSGDRRADRQLAVHERADRRRSCSCSWRPARPTASAPARCRARPTSSAHDQGGHRPRRHDLPVLRDQPVRRLFQLQQHRRR